MTVSIEIILNAIAGACILALAAMTCIHAIATKPDPRQAFAWVGLSLLAPLLGSILYALVGINRIERRVFKLQKKRGIRRNAGEKPSVPSAMEAKLGSEGAHLLPLARLVGTLVRAPLQGGARIDPLVEGEEAYPRMLEAIETAERTISLTVYIFGDDPAGRRFMDALARARARGVQVRVMIDDVGTSSARIERTLERAGIPVRVFIPRRIPWRLPYMNMRNHRKILVVDGKIGFTGGMNIESPNLHSEPGPDKQRDIHFQVQGPVVADLQTAFAEDWLFCTGETLSGDGWFPDLTAAGDVFARGIPDGPDHHYEGTLWALLGAVGCARRSVRIVTPYFVPDPALIAALNVAALRGVEVEVFQPQRTDVLISKWASTSWLEQILARGCRVWSTPPPFDHTKLAVVDGQWILFGSANLDNRSFRLNFEFNVECYDRELAGRLERLIDERRGKARPVGVNDLRRRPALHRLRDRLAWLFSPLL